MPERRDDQATLAESLGEAAAPCGIARRSRSRPDAPTRPAPSRRTLFRKYFLTLSVAMVVPLVANGAAEAWFGYRDQRARLDDLLRAEARGAAARIQGFMDGIRDQLGWTVQLPWSEETAKGQQLAALRLLRQVPAIVDLTRVDGEGHERLYLSRLDPNRIGSGIKRSDDPAVLGARSAGTWYGSVTYHRGTEPFMTMAVAGNRPAVGVAAARINLKGIWDVVSVIHVGRTGQAFILDRPGRLVAHPDLSLVLRGTDDAASEPLRRLRDAILAGGGEVGSGEDGEGRTLLAALTSVPGVDWTIVVQLPASEALAPVYAALRRTGGLLLAGAALAGALAFRLARRIAGPIEVLEKGTERIGAGRFEHRIEIATGDEFERLAVHFNEMAAGLAVSQERSERIARLRQFLAPQVAELVDRSGDDRLLEGHRAEVVAVFCDLRGFTAFSALARPEQVMAVLAEYHQVIGAVVTRYEATLTSFSGDGLMVLVNAPVPRPDPGAHALRMAIEMQAVVQALTAEWRSRGHAIGFGVGLAMGPATVGRIGYEGRLEYTAIGSPVNLASRLCSAADDGQVLADRAVAEAAAGLVATVPMGARPLKGYDQGVLVFAVEGTGPETPGRVALEVPEDVSARRGEA